MCLSEPKDVDHESLNSGVHLSFNLVLVIIANLCVVDHVNVNRQNHVEKDTQVKQVVHREVWLHSVCFSDEIELENHVDREKKMNACK